MGQSFFIAQTNKRDGVSLKVDDTKHFMPGGKTIAYLASILLKFLPQDFNYEDRSIKGKKEGWPDFKEFLNYFHEAGEAMGLESLNKTQFNQVYQALLNGYNFLKNLALEERNKWIAENTIYGHVEDLWNHNTWGTYKNYRGEERNNNMKNVLEDVLDMMRLDDRYDEEMLKAD